MSDPLGSPTAQDLFKLFLSREIVPFLKSRGFARKGQTFNKWIGRNCQVINFQGNKWNTRARFEFAVNLGVFNRLIFQFEWENDAVPKAPRESSCHWRERLVAPSNRMNQWWGLESESEIPSLGNEIRSALETFGIVQLDRYVTDDGLRDLMLGRKQVELHLAILLAGIGPSDEFDRVIAQYRSFLQDRGLASIAERNIQRLNAGRHTG